MAYHKEQSFKSCAKAAESVLVRMHGRMAAVVLLLFKQQVDVKTSVLWGNVCV